jgi:hypothetical protein
LNDYRQFLGSLNSDDIVREMSRLDAAYAAGRMTSEAHAAKHACASEALKVADAAAEAYVKAFESGPGDETFKEAIARADKVRAQVLQPPAT